MAAKARLNFGKAEPQRHAALFDWERPGDAARFYDGAGRAGRADPAAGLSFLLDR
jgi:hypothetical protein